MGLLGRIKSKSEKIIGEKSSTKIKDDITNEGSGKIEIKSSENIQNEQGQNELDVLRNELSEKSLRLESISEKLGLSRKEYDEIIAKIMESKKLLNENKDAVNEIREAKSKLDEARKETTQANLELKEINLQKDEITSKLLESTKKLQEVDSEFEQRTKELEIIKKQLGELRTKKKKETGQSSKQIVESASQVVAATNKRLQKALEELEMVRRILEKEKAEHAELKKKVKS